MADIELTTNASVPAGTSLTITVYEDTNGDGTADNSASQAIDNGTNTYTLAGFQEASGNDYWWDASLDHTDDSKTATINSVEIDVTTQLATPTNLSATAVSGDQIDLTWTDNASNEDGYKVERSEDGVAFTEIADLAANSTSHSDTGLEDGEKFWYRVKAYSATETDSDYSNEDDATTTLPAPTLDSLDASVEDEITVNWTLNDDSPDGDVEIYRSTDGTLGSIVHTETTLSTTSFTDTGLGDGEEYHYTVRRNTDHAASDSSQVSATTILPAPSGLSATSIDNNQIDLSWTDNADNEDGYRVLRSVDGGAFSQTGGDLAANTESFSDTGLLDGEEYTYKVRVFTEHSTADSGTDVATTSLPDAAAPTLDNSTEDQLGVSWTDAIDNGDYRVQYRETGAGTWILHGTFGEATTSTNITGLEDGEEYEVRMRTETEHVTGAWTTPVSEVTALPAPSGLSATTASDTQIDLSWTDDADNEDGFKILREQQVDGSWWPVQEIDDIAADSVSYSDTTVQPDRTYRYTVRVHTEHTTSDSNTDTATTTGPGLPTALAPAQGWYAEVDLPNGETVRPRIASDARFVPILNDLPRCRLPVEKSPRWESADIDEQPLRVWEDGYRLPIDEVRTITREEGRDVIHGIGGTELDEYVDGIEFTEEEAHTAAQTVVNDHTTYTPNVDDPQTNTRDNVLMQDADTEAEFQDVVPAHPFSADTPLEITVDGRLRATQVARFLEGESGSGDGTEVIDQDGDWSGDRSIRMTGGDSRSWVWQVDSTVPQNRGRVVLVIALPSDPTPGLTITFDGTEIESFTEGSLNGTASNTDLRTYKPPVLNSGGDLSPGSYTLTIDVTGSENVYIDFLHFQDDRWSYDEDITPVNGVVTGWQQMPESQDVEFAAVSSVEQVNGALFTVVIDDTTGNQALHARKDTGDAYTTQSNTDTLDHTFASSGQQIQGKVTLGRHDSGTESGQFGDVSQTIDSFELRADLEDTPVVLDKSYHDKLKNILNRISEAGDFIWEVRRDGGSYSVEWTQAGQRTTDRELDFVEFSGQHTVEESYEKIIVFGASEVITDERFTVSSSTGFGALVGLDESWIVTSSETVYDPNTGTEYTRRTDYNMDWQEGAIELINGGGMSLDTEYAIDYNRKTRGEYELPSATNPRAREVHIAGASTDRECEQFALGLVKKLQDPLEEIDFMISEADPRWALVDALSSGQLPFDGPLEVRELDNRPGMVRGRLGTRQSIDEAVQEIRNRLDAISGRV